MKKYIGLFLLIIGLNLGIMSFNICSATISDEISKLERREIITKRIPSLEQDGFSETQAIILIDAPVDKVWCFFDNCQNFPSLSNKLEKMEIIESQNDYQKIKAQIKIASFLPRLNYVLLFDKTDKNKSIKFKKIEGTYKYLDGTIELKPHNNGTILTYKMHSDSGIYVPEFIKKRTFKKDLPKIMNAIRDKAEKG